MKKSLYYFLVACLTIILLAGCSTPDEKANKLFVEASELIKSAQEVEETSYVDAFKLYEKSLTKLERITSKYPSSQLAVEIAQGKAKIGPYSIQSFRDVVLPLARRKAEAEQDPKVCAIFVAETMAYVGSKTIALSEIAGKYTAAKQFEQALLVARTIQDDTVKASVLAGISNKVSEAGQKEKAIEILSEALRIIKYDKAFALVVKVGQKEKALEIILETLQAARIIEDPDAKATALFEVAGKYFEVGEKGKATEILSEALQTARTIESYSGKASALVDIAGKYAEMGQFDKALRVARTIESYYMKASALAEIAGEYAKAEQFDQAIQVARAIKGYYRDYFKASALAEIVGEYARSGQFDQALQVARTIKEDFWKAFALTKIAEEFARAGQFDQALQIARSTENSFFKASASVKIADEYAKVGQFDQALQVAKTIKDNFWKASALAAIAVKYASTAQKVDDSAKKILHEIVFNLE